MMVMVIVKRIFLLLAITNITNITKSQCHHQSEEMGFLIQQFTLNYEKEKSSTYKSSHQDNMEGKKRVYALESTNNDIHSFHFGL